MTPEDYRRLEKEIRELAKRRAKDHGKCFGKCDSCGMETTLVSVVSLCGPCAFGEADTINGNW